MSEALDWVSGLKVVRSFLIIVQNSNLLKLFRVLFPLVEDELNFLVYVLLPVVSWLICCVG